MGNIFVKRNWQKDEKNIQKMFEELKTYRYPIWLISYPEGSRVTPKKIEMSQQFAKERNLPLLNTVLIPRTKGFVATVNALRNTHIKYVYDLTIYYEPVIPTVYDIFAHKLNDTKLIIHIKRYEISTLPSDESKLSQWLYERFQEKDKLIERLKKGDIPPQNNETPPLRVHVVVVHFLAAFVIALFAFLLCFIFI
jgi:lysophosphatidic acid acyltransferase/lysophosphatidylinositol acyltransferase